MDKVTIDGISISPLTKIEDTRGAVLHMIKNLDGSKSFGEFYFSIVNSGIIKGWKLHKEMSQNFCVPSGKIQFVFYDGREHSSSFGKILEVETGYDDYKLISVPPNIWYSFKSISNENSIIANCASIPHKFGESLTMELDSPKIPYCWSK